MSYNRVIIEGHCGADPKITAFDNGSKIAAFSLATTERGYKTKDGKEIPDRTDWHNIVVRGSLIKVVEGYVKKGTSLLVEGKLRNRDYEKEGRKIRITEIYADFINLTGGKPQSVSSGQSEAQVLAATDTHWADAPQGGDDLPF